MIVKNELYELYKQEKAIVILFKPYTIFLREAVNSVHCIRLFEQILVTFL